MVSVFLGFKNIYVFFTFIFLNRQYMVHKSKYYKKVYSEKKCSHPCPHSPTLPQVITFISFWCFLPGFLYSKNTCMISLLSYTKSILCTLFWTFSFYSNFFLMHAYDHCIIVFCNFFLLAKICCRLLSLLISSVLSNELIF